MWREHHNFRLLLSLFRVLHFSSWVLDIMHSTQVILVTFVFASLLCCALSRSVPEHARSRVRRQAGDMRVAHLRAENALKQLAPKACAETGCGLIDIITSGKRKRSEGSELNEYPRSSKLQLLRRLVDDLLYGDS